MNTSEVVLGRFTTDRTAFMRLLTIKTILIATDLTDTSAAAVASAVRLADAAGAAVHIAHVVRDRSELDRAADYERDIEATLASMEGATPHQTHLVCGEPPEALSSLADTIKADVVVIGRRVARQQTASDRPVGSMAYTCVTRTLVPVLVIAQPLSLPLRNALVAVDASEAARGTLLLALSWSAALRAQDDSDCKLTVLHVDTGTDPAEDAARVRRSAIHDADVLQRNAPGWSGVSVERVTVRNWDAATAISRHAVDSGAALVVMGTRSSADHGQSIWGSVSAAVTRQLAVPILLVPPAFWRDHVRDIDPF